MTLKTRWAAVRGSRRQTASVGAAALGILPLAGAALGTGIARTAVAVSDGLTWLGDDERGEVVQVDPASGRPETRLAVAGGEAELDIIQRDGSRGTASCCGRSTRGPCASLNARRKPGPTPPAA